MAIYRIGIGSDFQIKDSAVGIGESTTGIGNLNVDGTLRGKSAGGISTITQSSAFYADKNLNNDITFTGEHSTIGDVVVGVTSTFIVSTGATVTVGAVESVSIGTHFSLPTGGTEERPEAVHEGMVRFNIDLNTLEFYNGVEWRQFNVNGSSGRGVIGPSPSPSGGQVTDSTITSISMINEGRQVAWGNLAAGPYAQNAACSSSTRIIFGGGTTYVSPWAVIDNLDYKAIASDGDTQDFGNLTDARRSLTSLSNSTRGVFIGGVEPSQLNIIDYVEISTAGNALDFGDTITAGRHQPSACASPVRGVFVHGNPNNRDYIEVIEISSKGNSTEFGQRLFNGGYATGVCNGVRAFFAGGYQQTPIAGNERGQIGKVLIASNGNESYFGDLSVARYHCIGLASKTRGLFAGGTPNAGFTRIDSALFESNGIVEDFGDLDRPRWSTDGSTDCHGGLGGY